MLCPHPFIETRICKVCLLNVVSSRRIVSQELRGVGPFPSFISDICQCKVHKNSKDIIFGRRKATKIAQMINIFSGQKVATHELDCC